MPKPSYFIGIISGTSMDAVDCILADFSTTPPKLLCSHSESYPESLREEVLSLCAAKSVAWRSLGETDIRVGQAFACAINNLLKKSDVDASDILAIGSHGQTVQHQPEAAPAFTIQIGDPNTIAALTRITTIADFRRKDMAVGGQGAPLAPLFHQAYFACADKQRVVLNLGGIANISILPSPCNTTLTGFDTGPANVLMDTWIKSNQGANYDHDGEWAAQGSVNEELLAQMLQEPYLIVSPPKSTGRELFNSDWLGKQLSGTMKIAPVDVQATLLEFTAQTVCNGIKQSTKQCNELIVCGGGSKNKVLVARIAELLDETTVFASDELGLPADWVEAMAFAWIAEQTLNRKRIDCTSVTGARYPCILGGIYYSE